MNLRELPGFPELYLDLVDFSPPAAALFAKLPGRDALLRRASEVAAERRSFAGLFPDGESVYSDSPGACESLRLLRQPGCVAVVAGIGPEELGGPMMRLLQCLTAYKVAAFLRSEGCPAVPVAWIDPDPAIDREMDVVDGDGQLVTVNKVKHDDISRIYAHNINKSESYQWVERAYGNGGRGSKAAAVLYSGLLADLGLPVVDGADPGLTSRVQASLRSLAGSEEEAVRRIRQAGYEDSAAVPRRPSSGVPASVAAHALLPVAAYVVAPPDIYGAAVLAQQSGLMGLGAPLFWPYMSATLVDARSRKMFEKFRLGLPDLFDGHEALLSKVDTEVDEAGVTGAFGALSSDIDSRLQALSTRVPAAHALIAAIEDSRSRMHYQLTRVRERYESSLTAKREASVRQLARLCNSLAPRRRRQEEQLAAIHFVLRYSRAVLNEIVTKSDVWNFQHQLISLD